MPESPLLILTAIGIASFLECLAFVGVLVPGVVVLFSLAALANAQDISVIAVLCFAAAGGFIGDIVSFNIGKHLLPELMKRPKFSQYDSWIEQGSWFIGKWGWLSVIVGRFLGPIRPIIPLTAGALGMKPRLFFTLSFFTCLAWAPAYLLPGYFTGELSELWKLQPLDIRSLLNYLLTALAICLFTVTIYHHMHPEKMHVRGWITHRQSKHWPIAPLALLLLSSTAFLVIWAARPLNADSLFENWSHSWLHIQPLTRYMYAIASLAEARLMTLNLGVVLLWLILINRYSVTVMIITGYLMLLAATTLISNPAASNALGPAAGLSSFTFFSGILANLYNSAQSGLKRWPAYLAASLATTVVATSILWLGQLPLSTIGLSIFLSVAMAATVRTTWRMTGIHYEAPISKVLLTLIGMMNIAALVLGS